ncbi:TPA: EpsG family protein [Enterobacter cloacae]|nr:EpsG family protein [Enterobacter pasteurii]
MNIHNENLSPEISRKLVLFFFPLSIFALFCYPLMFLVAISLISPLLTGVTRKLYYFVLMIFIVIFFASLKPFGDLAEYLNIYKDLNANLLDVFGYSRFGNGLEFMFLLFMKVIGSISNGNEQFFLVATYALIVICLSNLIKGIDSRYKLLILGLFFFNLGFMEVSSYFLRQVLSILIFLNAINKRTYKKWLLFIIAVTFHVSAVINIAIYLLAVLLKGRKISFIAVFLSFSFAGLIFFGLLYVTPLYDFVVTKFLSVSENDKFSTLPLNYIIMTLANIVIILVATRKGSIYNNFEKLLFFKECFLFLILLSLPALSNRLGMIIFGFYPYFLLAYFKRRSININTREYVFFGSIFVINLLPFLYLMYNVSMGNNMFTFLEGKPLTANIYNIIEYFTDTFMKGVQYINEGN